MFEEQIREAQIKMDEARLAIDKFSDTIQAAVLDKTQNLTEVCKVMLEEKTKAQATVEKLDAEIRELERKKIIAKDRFENSTLPDFLQRTVQHFEKLPDTEKKKIIQTIIARIVIDPAKPEKIELLINPDPEGSPLVRWSINSIKSEMVELIGVEPTTPCLQSRCSTN